MKEEELRSLARLQIVRQEARRKHSVMNNPLSEIKALRGHLSEQYYEHGREEPIESILKKLDAILAHGEEWEEPNRGAAGRSFAMLAAEEGVDAMTDRLRRLRELRDSLATPLHPESTSGHDHDIDTGRYMAWVGLDAILSHGEERDVALDELNERARKEWARAETALREALEYYADPETWRADEDLIRSATEDMGETARNALTPAASKGDSRE